MASSRCQILCRYRVVRLAFCVILALGVIQILSLLNTRIPPNVHMSSSLAGAKDVRVKIDNAENNSEKEFMKVHILSKNIQESWTIRVIKLPPDNEDDDDDRNLKPTRKVPPSDAREKDSISKKRTTEEVRKVKRTSDASSTSKDAPSPKKVNSVLTKTKSPDPEAIRKAKSADVRVEATISRNRTKEILKNVTARLNVPSLSKDIRDVKVPQTIQKVNARGAKETHINSTKEEKILKKPSDEDLLQMHIASKLSLTPESSNVSKSRLSSQVVNPHDFTYIHNVPKACASRDVELLIGVTGGTDNFEARSAIRETWGHFEKDFPFHVVLLFILGATQNKSLQNEIHKEAVRHNDIVQESFIDVYYNLSLKTIALMKWASTFCPHSSFVLKVDDDMYINVRVLIKTLREYSSKTHSDFILGYVHSYVIPYRNKTSRSKYIISREEYAPDTFPEYVSGTAYTVTIQAAKKLYQASLYVPRLVFEDVYITGLVATKANVTRLHEPGFGKYTYDTCGLRKKISSGHTNRPSKLRKMYQELQDPNLKCDDANVVKSTTVKHQNKP